MEPAVAKTVSKCKVSVDRNSRAFGLSVNEVFLQETTMLHVIRNNNEKKCLHFIAPNVWLNMLCCLLNSNSGVQECDATKDS